MKKNRLNLVEYDNSIIKNGKHIKLNKNDPQMIIARLKQV
jgi:hypothetical protein